MKRPALMGIVNVTPDSFSGDGKMARAAVHQAQMLANSGADILDLGAESTRPGAMAITAEEEWARLEPVLHGIIDHAWRARVRLSVDTRYAETAARALDLGVDIINDVGGLADTAMLEILEEHDNDVVVMHALDVPVNPAHTLPEGCDVVAEILAWKARVTERARGHGIATHRLIYDPGIGFGKTPAQSLALIAAAATFKQSGGRWLYGHSRKSFLTTMTDAPPAQRDAATRAVSQQLAAAGVDYLRVHDVVGHAALFEQV